MDSGCGRCISGGRILVEMGSGRGGALNGCEVRVSNHSVGSRRVA